MADSIASAWVEVLPDFSDFPRKANQGITSSLSKAGDDGARAAGLSMKGVFGGSFFGTIAAGAGLALADGIVQGLKTGVQFGLDGIDLASSLGEQTNAVQVSFGELSAGVLALAEDAPKNLNITRAAFNKTAVRFSAFAKTIAGNGGDVTKVVKDLTQRGADFASVYDIDVNDALQLFQSGLAGESEPLRAYGVDISDATIKAFAYTNGIAKQGDQLTEAQKVQARYGSILAQTNQVTGDLANTSGSLANQQRALAVGVEEAQTQLGEYLLPAFTEVVAYANSELLPKFGDIIDTVGPRFAQALEDNGPAIQAVVDKLGPLAEKLTDLAVEKLPDVIEAGGDLVAAIPGWVDALSTLTDTDNPLDNFANNLFEVSGLINDAINGRGPTVTGTTSSSDFWAEEGRRDGLAYSGTFLAGGGASADLLVPRLQQNAGRPGGLNDFWTGSGASAGGAYQNGIYGAGPLIATAAAAVGYQGAAAADKAQVDFTTAGGHAGDGFASGLTLKKGLVGEAGAALGREAVTNLRKELRISSPSKVMEQMGIYTGQGFENGLKASMPAITVQKPALSDFAVGGEGGASAVGGVTEINFNGADASSVWSLAKQELRSGLGKIA